MHNLIRHNKINKYEYTIRIFFFFLEAQEYLQRGHIVARADKLFKSDQQSTYFYANTLPMWEQINRGNWFEVEKCVRDIATEKKTYRQILRRRY